MGKTSIEWCDYTINPIRARNIETGAVGHFCEKVSPGCANCYASEWNERVRPQANGKLIGTGLAFLPENRGKVEIFLDDTKLQEVLGWKTPRRIFWCDMSDLFGEWVTDAMLDRCFAVMAMTPQHTHILVTKRAQRMHDYLTGAGLDPRGPLDASSVRFADIAIQAMKLGAESIPLLPFPNVWLIVSAENQAMVKARVPWLLRTPAAVRGISAEPLLERLDVVPYIGGNVPADGDWHDTHCIRCGELMDDGCTDHECPPGFGPRLQWVIGGGESGRGKKIRPCAVEWLESLVDQCESTGTAAFVKQTGSYTVSEERTAPIDMMSGSPESYRGHLAPNGEVWAWRAGLGKDTKGGNLEALPPEKRVRQWPLTEVRA